MNKFEEWIVTRIIKREVRQGFGHRQNIIDLYKMIRVACENEFYEDNTVTMNSNLKEWFEQSLRNPTK
jgi:predicted component of viral defense system (DUF524 family)